MAFWCLFGWPKKPNQKRNDVQEKWIWFVDEIDRNWGVGVSWLITWVVSPLFLSVSRRADGWSLRLGSSSSKRFNFKSSESWVFFLSGRKSGLWWAYLFSDLKTVEKIQESIFYNSSLVSRVNEFLTSDFGSSQKRQAQPKSETEGSISGPFPANSCSPLEILRV